MIYLDHNATSPMLPAVSSAMAAFERATFANPASPYAAGRAARQALDEARERLAAVVGARPAGTIFCGGATEALALTMLALARARPGGHLVTTAVEHAAVRRTAELLADGGWRVTYVKPQRTGLVPAETFAAALRDDTFLAVVQQANNELGTIQPVRTIADVCRRRGIPVLVDAVQGPGKLPVNLTDLGADMLVVSAHKIGGPKGVGALCCGYGVEPPVLLPGGGQEFGCRGGTPNVAGAVGLALAVELAEARRPTLVRRWRALREELTDLPELLPDTRLNGHPTETLANTLSLACRGVDARELCACLDERGLAVSPGSACGCAEPSAVLTAIGLDEPAARGTFRVSFGPDTQPLDLQALRAALLEVVPRLRARGLPETCGDACRR